MTRAITILLTVSLFMQSVAFATGMEAAGPCLNCSRQDGAVTQVRALCQTIAHRCADVPKEKRMTCEPNPLMDQAMGIVGCVTGVFNSVVDLVKFIIDIGKFLITTQVKAIGAGAKLAAEAARDPIGTAKRLQDKARKITRAQAMSVGQLSNYVVREFEVSRRKVGIFKAIPDMAKRIMGPIVKTIWQEIEGFVSQQVHNFTCYNARARAEMVCKVIADFVIPPAAIVGLLKGGGRKLLQQFPKMANGLRKIAAQIASNTRLAAREANIARQAPAAQATRGVVATSAVRAPVAAPPKELVERLARHDGSLAQFKSAESQKRRMSAAQREALDRQIEAASAKIREVKRSYASVLSSTTEDKNKIISLIVDAERKGISPRKIEETMRRAERECSVP
jgi:hypothetical protein